jgi:hypothetical protein
MVIWGQQKKCAIPSTYREYVALKVASVRITRRAGVAFIGSVFVGPESRDPWNRPVPPRAKVIYPSGAIA